MTLENVLGQPSLFRLSESTQLPEDLSIRERRLLVGALNFHALMAPGRELTVHGYTGDWGSLPRTSDDSTFDGLSRAFGSREFTVTSVSAVAAEDRIPGPSEAPSLQLAASPIRHIHVSRDSVLDFDPPRDISPGLIRQTLRAIRARTPLMYDELRDIELLRHRRALRTPAPRRHYEDEFRKGGSHEDAQILPAPSPIDGAPRAVLLGLHWFELGGAERWAFETVRLVREAGFLPIVLTNRDSHQPWIARPELDGALVIPFSEATVDSQTPGVEELLRGILRSFDVRGVVVHHNQWLYDRLHWIARSRPGIPIIDSTHIVEYRGGGYPLSSAMVDEVITTHHVISPTLGRWMTEIQGIPEAKVVMAPLGGLTVELKDASFRARTPDQPFTVAFVGRMARQKAPEVFVAMARRLRRSGRDIRFIMHGDGEMASWVDDLLRASDLADVVRRDSSVPVSQTLEEAHVLVVPSHNEGLTLTTLEAIAHGVPVVSTDVGAQSDIVPPRALVSRNVHQAVSGLARVVATLADDEAARQQLWRDERKAEKKLLAQESASEWFAKEVRSW
ncbi:glycosyltransferase [Microbacterium sp. NPDC058389]|uniref:glycosyltransferase n=1 Tax=Microbacterium sp. NPDC058389 TaxID=3346475 RepID=UPI003659B858